jgi:hypothetical protein
MKRWKWPAIILLALLVLVASLFVVNAVIERSAIAAAAGIKVGMSRAQVHAILGEPRKSGIGFSEHPGFSVLHDADWYRGPVGTIKRRIDLWLWETGRDRWRDRLGTAGRQSDWAVIIVYDQDGKVYMVVTRGKTIEPQDAADPVEFF